MSQLLSSAMLLALAQPTTYLCRIWKLTLANGTVYRFTDNNIDIVSEGELFQFNPGMQVSAVKAANAGRDNNATITTSVSDTFISMSELRQGALDNAAFDLWIVDWRDPDLYERIPRFSGAVNDVRFMNKGLINIELSGDIRINGASDKIGEVYSRTCRALLGDNRCQVDIEALSFVFTVDNVTDNGFTITASELVGAVDDYFKFGKVLWITGANAGITDEVKSSANAAGTFTVTYTPRNVYSVGDTGRVYPGCDKQVQTCGDKFNNLPNHRAEPYAQFDIYAGGVTPIPVLFANASNVLRQN